MFTFLRHKSRTFVGIITGVSALFISVLLFTTTCEKAPTKEESAALEILPGYMFVVEGNTNVINQYGSIKRFQSQHRLMPYLGLVAEKFRVYNWPKEWPVRINETETAVIITWPSEGEFLEERRSLWSAPYLLEVVIDKKNMRIVSALRGP